MGGDSEYEPNDSRNVTGTARTPDARWSGDKPKPGHGGEYEPQDSRNVTGTAPDKAGSDPGAGDNRERGKAPEDEQEETDNPEGGRP